MTSIKAYMNSRWDLLSDGMRILVFYGGRYSAVVVDGVPQYGWVDVSGFRRFACPKSIPVSAIVTCLPPKKGG